MLMSLKSIKDRAVQALALKYINSEYQEFGSMTKLEIDSTKKNIHAELELRGETQMISVDVLGYQVIESGGKTLLQLGEVKISREWINTAFQKFVTQRTFEIPEWLRAVL